MTVRLYCGVGESSWNGHPIRAGKYACISPVSGAAMNRPNLGDDTQFVMADSGAFSDRHTGRVTPDVSLLRQLHHARKYRYYDRLELLTAYDAVIADKEMPSRGELTPEQVISANIAYQQTIEAAQFLRENAPDNIGICLPVQGLTKDQYLTAAEMFSKMLTPKDCLGLGGWAVLGRRKYYVPLFHDYMRELLPLAASLGVRRIHIFGLIYPRALAPVAQTCAALGIKLSVDSMTPNTGLMSFGIWGYDFGMGIKTRVPYDITDPKIHGKYRELHVKQVRWWLHHIHHSKWYKPL